jgi:hypothetical protein
MKGMQFSQIPECRTGCKSCELLSYIGKARFQAAKDPAAETEYEHGSQSGRVEVIAGGTPPQQHVSQALNDAGERVERVQRPKSRGNCTDRIKDRRA